MTETTSGGGGARRSGETAPGARVIDTSIMRVHKHGSGARRDQGPQDIGRSRGGWTTKLHVSVDDCGGLRSLHLTPGQWADSTEALRLLEDIEAGMTVVADKAYDANAILARIADAGATAAIPAKSIRKTPRLLDAAAYARRNVVERLFAGIQGVPAGSHALQNASASHRIRLRYAYAKRRHHGISKPYVPTTH